MLHSHRIVRATPDDLPTIERIARATWPDTFASILEPEQIEYMLQMMYRPEALREQLEQGHVFHLLLGGQGQVANGYGGTTERYRAVGYVSHQLDYLPDTTKIHKLYVLPNAQGKGYGRALLETVERLAVRAGQKDLRLDVNYRNRAISFYEQQGFDKIERFDTEIGDGFLMEDWRMAKLLI